MSEHSAGAREQQIRGTMIRLGQLLKFSGMAESGADAKRLLADQEVTVNGEIDERRGRQLHDGDVVECGGERVVVVNG